MHRLKTINQVDKLEVVDYEYVEHCNGEYVVDDSNFIPMSEAVRQLTTNQVGQDIINQYYDFPTGKDTGETVPFSRTKDCNDIAVLSSNIAAETAELAEKSAKNKAAAEKRAAFEAELKAASAGDTSAPKE